MVSKIGGVSQNESLENLPSRVEQKNPRVTYLTVSILDKLKVTSIRSRRPPSTQVPSISTGKFFAIQQKISKLPHSKSQTLLLIPRASPKKIWKLEISDHTKRNTQLHENSKHLYSLIWGQYSEYMQSRLKSNHTYHTSKACYDTIGLIKLTKGVTFKFENQKYLQNSVHSAQRTFIFYFRQGTWHMNGTWRRLTIPYQS